MVHSTKLKIILLCVLKDSTLIVSNSNTRKIPCYKNYIDFAPIHCNVPLPNIKEDTLLTIL